VVSRPRPLAAPAAPDGGDAVRADIAESGRSGDHEARRGSLTALTLTAMGPVAKGAVSQSNAYRHEAGMDYEGYFKQRLVPQLAETSGSSLLLHEIRCCLIE
jgi:hypothetical protein